MGAARCASYSIDPSVHSGNKFLFAFPASTLRAYEASAEEEGSKIVKFRNKTYTHSLLLPSFSHEEERKRNFHQATPSSCSAHFSPRLKPDGFFRKLRHSVYRACAASKYGRVKTAMTRKFARKWKEYAGAYRVAKILKIMQLIKACKSALAIVTEAETIVAFQDK